LIVRGGNHNAILEPNRIVDKCAISRITISEVVVTACGGVEIAPSRNINTETEKLGMISLRVPGCGRRRRRRSSGLARSQYPGISKAKCGE